MNDYKFGNFLCALREKKGMTQADVANKLGVTPAAVSKWENGSSKPRVEILFQLAQLLGVRAEELMSGEYIPDETLDPEAVKQINERYAYLMTVDTYNTTSVKWRRLLAWIIDWNVIGFAAILLLLVGYAVLSVALKLPGESVVIILMLVFLLFLVCFVLRDLIFGGRSLGKRIMGLSVLDRETGLPATGGKCALRNLFFFIAHIDVIIMLVSGATIGDRAANTAIVLKSALNNGEHTYPISEINTYSAPKKSGTKKTVITVVIIIVLFLVLLISVISFGLSAAKNTDEYKLAYSYLTESQAFKKLDVDESKIQFNQYSLKTYSVPESDSVTKTAELGFTINGKSYRVICHSENGIWAVCSECTKFN